jgi:hypothetical protein
VSRARRAACLPEPSLPRKGKNLPSPGGFDERTSDPPANRVPLVLGMCVLSHLTLENFITTGPA